MPRRHRRLAIAAITLLLPSVAACTSSQARVNATVSVQPIESIEDQPLSIAISGLAAGETATLGLASTDARDVKWNLSPRHLSTL